MGLSEFQWGHEINHDDPDDPRFYELQAVYDHAEVDTRSCSPFETICRSQATTFRASHNPNGIRHNRAHPSDRLAGARRGSPYGTHGRLTQIGPSQRSDGRRSLLSRRCRIRSRRTRRTPDI
jgi:hypothetical protein